MATITVEGTPYVLPALDTFDLDEAIILYNYSGLTFDQVWELEGLNPGVIKSLLHIAIQRSDRALRGRDIEEMVGRVNMMEVMVELSRAADEMPDPTKGAQPPLESDSPTSSDESTPSSGDAGDSSSEPSPEKSSPDSTGALTSDSTATSDPRTLVP